MWALVRRALRDARTRTLSFAYLFAIYGYVQARATAIAIRPWPTGSRSLTASAQRGAAAVLRLPLRPPKRRRLRAWRVGGTLAIVAAVFGVFARIRAMRTEEDAGRTELVLAGGVTRGSAYVSALIAIALCVRGVWSCELVGLLLGGLPAGESAYLALATVSVIPVFAGVGALSSQLAPTHRLALELGDRRRRAVRCCCA